MKTSAYVAVAAIAAAAGFLVYHYAIAPREQMAAVATPDTEEPQAAAATEESSALPAQLPDFTLGDLEGKPRSILSWPGKSMIVNFWATWCAPCRREIPLLRELQKQHGPEGFQIVGVAVDLREDVVKYAQEIGIDYPVLIGEQDGLDAVNKFGQGSIGFPFTVFTDNQGRIVLFHLGEIRKEQADVLFGAVRDVNSGKLTPAAARVVAAKQLAALPAEPSPG
ncbi:MAG TPA: TlpA disulfide reductase family protein [Steroidobacteraceae bacterium]|jgi:thiol-disulfide isomerase/thioredoxin|nr:TlpA disulfide reductase family protein [Steroidobacteraceae bacterium]